MLFRSRIDIAGRGNDGEGCEGQEASDPAGTNMVGQGHGRVTDTGGEKLDQAGRNGPKERRCRDHKDQQDGKYPE